MIRKRIIYIMLSVILLIAFTGCEKVKKTSASNHKKVTRQPSETGQVSSDSQKYEEKQEELISVTPLSSVVGEENTLQKSAIEANADCYYTISVAQF